MRPDGTPQQFVLLLQNRAEGPSPAEQALAERMVGAGAMVASVPLPPFYQRLAAQDGQCTYPGGAFENLSRSIQAQDHLPAYLLPLLVGTGPRRRSPMPPWPRRRPAPSPAACPSACARACCPPMCAGPTLKWQAGGRGGPAARPAALASHWMALGGGEELHHGPGPGLRAEGAAGRWLGRAPGRQWPAGGLRRRLVGPGRQQVPLGRRPASCPTCRWSSCPRPTTAARARPAPATFAVLISGDGGWASIDKGIAKALVAQGVPVAGLDSLRYFWSERTPRPGHRPGPGDPLLRRPLGPQQGDPDRLFARGRCAALRAQPPARRHPGPRAAGGPAGPGQKASFEFHVSNWIGPSGDKPILPEARKLSASNTLCVYGESEKDSLCPDLSPAQARRLPLTGGHHFGGDYEALAGKILEAAGR
jgi:hypothetical protein